MNALYLLFIYPITQLIELVFTFSQKIFKEPAVSVFAISLVINFFCFPLYNLAEKWQNIERNTAKKLKPEIDIIKSVFSGDKRIMLLQTYYRQNNYHPVYALRSGFGLLIQIPFFIAAYSYLSGLPALKGASFLFISDMGAPDNLLFGINVLPIAMTFINVLSGALYTKGFPLKEKVQLYGMSAVFLLLLYNSPSGLVIYWTMNNIFSLVKNVFYKIPFKNKKIIAASLFSFLFIFVSFYLLKIFKGELSLRILISSFFIFLSFIPWLVFLVKKINKKKSLPSFTLPRPDFSLFLFSILALWSLSGIFIPSMLIASSPQEFSFIDNYTTPLYFIFNTAIQAAGFFILWPLFIYFLFGAKIKTALSFLIPALFFCSLINTFVFPGNYGVISLELVFNTNINHSLRAMITNLLVLIIPFLLIFVFYRFKRIKIIITVVFLGFISMTFYSFWNMHKINNEFVKVKSFRSETAEDTNTITPIFHLSKKGKNTIVIMLDRAISVFIPSIFDESPELKEIYSGFVYYPNTVSFNGYTRIATPPLFGGYEYTPLEMNRRENVSVQNKHNEALLLMPRIFSEAGYSVTVTDPPYPNYSSREDLSIYESYPDIKAHITDTRYNKIWLNEHDLAFPSTGDILKRNILWYSFFRISPFALRRGIYLQGDWCAPSLMQKMTLTLNGYTVLDYLKALTDFDSEKENSAVIMVNNTTHEPSFLQAPEYRPAQAVTNFGSSAFGRETAYHVNAASIKRLAEWFIYMKENNVYDNTRIIIVSDHGPEPNFLVKSSLPINIEQFNALLLVKDFNSSGILKTDPSFMSNADVPFLALKEQIENPVNPFTGKPISAEAKTNPLYIAASGSIHLEDPNAAAFTLNPQNDYYVHANIFDEKNWKKAEK